MSFSRYTKEGILHHTKEERAHPDLKCLFWLGSHNQPSWLLEEDNRDWFAQLSEWREEIASGKMCVIDSNHTTKSHSDDTGRKFWGLNIQYTNEEINQSIQDPLSPLLFGWICAGHTYWFPDQSIRDLSLKILKKKKGKKKGKKGRRG